MTTFKDLAIGQEFDFNIDADGYEPYFYKVNDTEAYQFSGRGEGGREEFDPDMEVHSSGHIRKVSETVTEVERVALTMIYNHGAIHPVLSHWKSAIVTDTSEHRSIHEFAWDNREMFIPMFNDSSFAFPKGKYDRDCNLFGLILDGTPAGKFTKHSDPVNTHYRKIGGHWDRPLAILCHAVIDYRKAGRPSGDQTHTIQGMGGPLLRVSTSLAAAIVEYHTSIQNLIYLDKEDN